MARKTKKTKIVWVEEPQSEADYINLANELLEWAQQESSITINGFPIKKMMPTYIFHRLPANSTQFSQAYDIALGIIGSRRERLAHERMLNAQIVRETMPIYDLIYRKWLISEKHKEENVGETKIVCVEIPRYLDCPDGSHEKEVAEYETRKNLKMQAARQEALKSSIS